MRGDLRRMRVFSLGRLGPLVYARHKPICVPNLNGLVRAKLVSFLYGFPIIGTVARAISNEFAVAKEE